MRALNNKVSEAIDNLQNFHYCFEITLKSGSELFLTSTDRIIHVNSKIYKPVSGLNVMDGFFNDCAQDYIHLEGVYEKGGIDREIDLVDAKVKIFVIFSESSQHLVTYYCTLYTKHDLSFSIKLEPESIKYNQTIIDTFSQTCRANFGDLKCKVDKLLYSKTYNVIHMGIRSVELTHLDCEGGYFLGGELNIPGTNFKSKILSSNANTINIDRIIPDNLKNYAEVLLTTGCDKKFITCCNRFDNAVNFRGEPFIPEYNFLKIN